MFLVHANDVSILGRNIYTIKKDTEAVEVLPMPVLFT
jgi:hypothetical protein